MLKGYELATFASRLDYFRCPHGIFCSCLLGLRRACTLNRAQRTRALRTENQAPIREANTACGPAWQRQ